MLISLTLSIIIYILWFPVPYVNLFVLLSDKCSGGSIATFIRCDKLKSDHMFHKRDFNFICENSSRLCQADCGKCFRFGYIAPIISLVANSCSCVVTFSFGC